jgi:hypothetical protein
MAAGCCIAPLFLLLLFLQTSANIWLFRELGSSFSVGPRVYFRPDSYPGDILCFALPS